MGYYSKREGQPDKVPGRPEIRVINKSSKKPPKFTLVPERLIITCSERIAQLGEVVVGEFLDSVVKYGEVGEYQPDRKMLMEELAIQGKRFVARRHVRDEVKDEIVETIVAFFDPDPVRDNPDFDYRVTLEAESVAKDKLENGEL